MPIRYEEIVLTFRTLADRSRLRILLLLAFHEELSASAIADKAHLSRPNTSFHLKMLCASGLVIRRRSGSWIFHSLRDTAENGWPVALVRMIRESVRDRGVKQLRDHRDLAAPAVRSLIDALFRVATAFTNVRRLLMVSQLRKRPARGPEELRQAVPMSHDALSRHLAKLSGRGYLHRSAPARGDMLRIPSTFESRIQARVLSAVFEALDMISKA